MVFCISMTQEQRRNTSLKGVQSSWPVPNSFYPFIGHHSWWPTLLHQRTWTQWLRQWRLPGWTTPNSKFPITHCFPGFLTIAQLSGGCCYCSSSVSPLSPLTLSLLTIVGPSDWPDNSHGFSLPDNVFKPSRHGVAKIKETAMEMCMVWWIGMAVHGGHFSHAAMEVMAEIATTDLLDKKKKVPF